MGLGVLKP